MTQIFTGSGLGIHNSSLGLGSYGSKGASGLGQGGESVYVNAANGNLVVQQSDGFLADKGFGLNLFQTYNSRGEGGSNWRFSVQTRLELQGTENTLGSVVTRLSEDGHRAAFHYDENQKKYLPEEGGTESLVFQNKEWKYKKGREESACIYNQGGQLTQMADQEGHAFKFHFSHGELSAITDASGKQDITWTFAQGLVQDLRMSSEGQVIHHLHYDYNEKNQLSKVSRDLGDGKSYWIRYDYVADSDWIKDIKQSDGTSLHIEYDAAGRVRALIDGEGRCSTYRYESDKTTFTNGLGEEWTYWYDEHNRLRGIDGPEHYCLRYTYEGAHLKSMTQGHETWRYTYNEQGDCLRTEEPNGQITQRVYDAEHHLLLESHYQNLDDLHQPIDQQSTRYSYNEQGALRFAINSSGTVTEYRYDAEGQRTSTRSYWHSAYDLSRLSPDEPLTEEALLAWVKQQQKQDISLVEYAYDWRGQLREERHYAQVDAEGQGMAQGVLTRFRSF